ncbi:hypothetical protein KA005_53565 [bacterium]|nr:hypothetical protein [bacterium]
MAREQEEENEEYHLKVYDRKSVLVKEDRTKETFLEGGPSRKARENSKTIKKMLDSPFLDKLITEDVPSIRSEEWNELDYEVKKSINKLVDSLTSEIGRALVGLTFLQLCVKSITPDQSIRLHKGGGQGSNFSWKDGISMRSLDRQYITPTLRRHRLLRLNRDGFMMTRTLAENYPYTKVYKAAIRGAKNEWVLIVDWLEKGNIDPLLMLKYLIAKLISRRDETAKLEENALIQLEEFIGKKPEQKEVTELLKTHIQRSQYGSRLLEIAIHSFFQVLEEEGLLEEKLSPLSQMRSANLKHDNIGDVEVVSPSSEYIICEAWDSKYGKYYLDEELAELRDKLSRHSETKIVGFVTDGKPKIDTEIKTKIEDIENEFEVDVYILDFDEFIDFRLDEYEIEDFGSKWINAYVESLAQKRRDRAPIDEPCGDWLREITILLS